MAPDINSLPASTPNPTASTSINVMTTSQSNGEPALSDLVTGATAGGADSPPASPRLASVSLQAAATVNAGLQREPTRESSSGSLRHRQSPAGRRRSAVLMSLQLNDPAVPGPGEMIGNESPLAGLQTSSPQPMSGSPLLPARADPHHNRAPSLGELHQELEAEQEAQVNRLLQMIRQQQLQLQQLQAGPGGQNQSAVVGDDSAILSERSATGASQAGSAPQSAHPSTATAPHHHHHPSGSTSGSFSRSPGIPHHPRSSFDMARADLQRRSRTPSRGASPRLRATSISGESDQWVLGGRDESAFYQAETQMLVRENQMLRHRIRDLERQVTEANLAAQVTHEPAHHSHLLRAQSVDDEPSRGSTPGSVEGPAAVGEVAKEA